MSDPRDRLLGELAGRYDDTRTERPDVIYDVANHGTTVELHVGIYQRGTDKVHPSFAVTLTKLQASIVSSMLRTRCKYGDPMGTPPVDQEVYNVITESCPLPPDGYMMTFGAFQRAGRQSNQIGQVILVGDETKLLASMLQGRTQ